MRSDDPAVWDEVARWWIDAVRDDPANSSDFLAVLAELTASDDVEARLTLEVGCGEGQVMRALGGDIIGTDISMPLLRQARQVGPVVRGVLPDLSWARSAAFDRCVCVGVLELVADHQRLLRELHRVTRSQGSLNVVMNHPVATSPHAAPLVDPAGEVLWRWGRYLTQGDVEQDLDDHTVVLHHRPLGDLVTAAADVGWTLVRLIEHGPSEATRSRYSEYFGHDQVPTLLGLRWSHTNSSLESGGPEPPHSLRP
jgi:SAM-dependent methyltransferase